MTDPHPTTLSLDERIEAVEQVYELMLGYAAQGKTNDTDEASGIRRLLRRADTALDGLADTLRATAPDASFHDFIAVLERDAQNVRAAFRLVLSSPALSSQLIDNLNASIHLRALLTDIFLLDEARKAWAND